MIDIPTDDVLYEIDGHTAYVTFNRPDVHNALSPALMDWAGRAIIDADEDEAVRAIVVTGAGEEAFSAGADLGDTIPERTAAAREGDGGRGSSTLMLKDAMITTPIVAAVNGVCVAGGMEFLQATDIRIAEEHARFGLQEPYWGLAPGGGSHVRLPRQIPYCRAMEFLLTGELFPAEHALEAGLVNEVVPKGESFARAEEVADRIAQNSPFAVSKIKETVVRGLELPPNEAFDLEAELSNEVFAHPDAEEGPKAFFSGEDPSFRP